MTYKPTRITRIIILKYNIAKSRRRAGYKQIRRIRKVKKAKATEAIQFTTWEGPQLDKPEMSGKAF